MTDTTAPDAITQVDREAAAANIKRRLVWQHGGEQPWMDASTTSMRMGEQDDHDEVQAFAAHRRLAAHGAGEGLREAFERAAKTAEDAYAPTPAGRTVRRNIAAAIRSLTPPTDAGSTTREGGEGVAREVGFDPKYSSILAQFGDPNSDIPTAHEIMIHGHIRMEAAEGDPHRLYDRAKAIIAAWKSSLATTSSPDASPDSGERVDPDHRAHLAFDRWIDRHPDAPAYWFRLPSWVQEYAAECVRQTERRLAASPASLSGGAEARDPHRVDLSDLIAAITNDVTMFDRFATSMFECWQGTGTSMEEGSASNDYRVWGNEARNRARHLRALLRDATWQRENAHPSPEAPANRQEAGE